MTSSSCGHKRVWGDVAIFKLLQPRVTLTWFAPFTSGSYMHLVEHHDEDDDDDGDCCTRIDSCDIMESAYQHDVARFWLVYDVTPSMWGIEPSHLTRTSCSAHPSRRGTRVGRVHVRRYDLCDTCTPCDVSVATSQDGSTRGRVST